MRIPELWPVLDLASSDYRRPPSNETAPGAREWSALEQIGAVVSGLLLPAGPCTIQRAQCETDGPTWTTTIRLPPRAGQALVWLYAVSSGTTGGGVTLTVTTPLGSWSVEWDQGGAPASVDVVVEVADPTATQTAPAEVEVELAIVAENDDSAAVVAWGVILLPLVEPWGPGEV